MGTTSKNLSRLVFASVFAALIAVLTAYIKIPSAFNNGYTHFGDSIIYLAGCILPMPYAVGAASIGGAFADLLSGAPNWMLPTAIIKACNIILFSFAYKTAFIKNKNRILNPTTAVVSVLSGIITIIGYFFATCIMYGTTIAIAELATYLVQPIGSAILFCILGIALDKTNFKARLSTK